MHHEHICEHLDLNASFEKTGHAPEQKLLAVIRQVTIQRIRGNHLPIMVMSGIQAK